MDIRLGFLANHSSTMYIMSFPKSLSADRILAAAIKKAGITEADFEDCLKEEEIDVKTDWLESIEALQNIDDLDEVISISTLENLDLTFAEVFDDYMVSSFYTSDVEFTKSYTAIPFEKLSKIVKSNRGCDI